METLSCHRPTTSRSILKNERIVEMIRRNPNEDMRNAQPVNTVTEEFKNLLVAKVDKLTSENEALRKDKERLDWLDKETPNIFCLCTWGDSTTFNDHEKPTGHIWEINCNKHSADLRQAIDAAMKKEGK